jgi:TolB protein
VDESFSALHKALTRELGWDYLSQLESALLPLTTPPQAGIARNWLYTGRAIAVSSLPMEAGWIAVSREDYSGVTYWRVWLKCRKQDGSCGKLIHEDTWDFNSRYSGDQTAYQEGGRIGGSLNGFWLDFTEFASRFGWHRMPAFSNWRSYFPASQLNVFVQQDGLSWEQALLEIYPPEAVAPIMENR